MTHAGFTSVPRADAGLVYLYYETAKFIAEIVKKPEEGLSRERLFQMIGRYTYSTITSQSFGMDVPDTENPVIEGIFETGLAQILGTLPGFYIVD